MKTKNIIIAIIVILVLGIVVYFSLNSAGLFKGALTLSGTSGTTVTSGTSGTAGTYTTSGTSGTNVTSGTSGTTVAR